MGKTIIKENLLDLDASHYVKNSSLQNNLAKQILNAYRINPKGNILDVGCGDGRITSELASRADKGKVLGIDASPAMIGFAAETFTKTEFPNLDFVCGMAEKVAIPKKLDLIVSFSCFHWLKDPKSVLRRLRSSLKIGGEILILTYPKESPYYRYLELALKKYPKYCLLSANHTMLSAKDYKKLLNANNFEILNFQQYNFIASYNNVGELKNYIRGWLNSYVQMPEYLHEPFLKQVCQEILNDSSTRKGRKIVIPYTALVMRARK